ncbi:MAG: hypothetical protein ACYTXY_08540 [Nostoc sp.]
MQLVIFDIDGTLTNTYKIDENCFVRAFALEFGIFGIHFKKLFLSVMVFGM